MNEDIVCLLQDLGKEAAIEVIANFILKNPDTEDLIAARIGSLLSSDSVPISIPESTACSSQDRLEFPSFPTSATLNFTAQSDIDRNYKMIFVVNMELNMGRGKQCAQVAHAALGLCLDIGESGNREVRSKMLNWLSMGQRKIVVKVEDCALLRELQQKAKTLGVPTYLVSDAGCTQVAPGSKTVLALFGSNEELDKITGSLRLL